MDFEKVADKCALLNKEHGFQHAVFVGAFILSLTALFFYIITPIVSSAVPTQTIGYWVFATPLALSILGYKIAKQERIDKVLEFIYGQSKIRLTIGTLCTWVILKLGALILSKAQDNGK
jgi:hypothetical protein